MDDISAQQDEILALKSIYEDEFFFDEKTRKGSFYVKIESLDSNDFRINFGKIFYFKNFYSSNSKSSKMK
jgi:hypothetical protein